MKQLLTQISVLMLASLSCVFTSCNSDGEVIPKQASVKIQQTDIPNSDNITVQFSPNETTANYSYAIGTMDDAESFMDETIPGLVKVSDNKGQTITFKDLEPETEYVVYALGYNEKGEQGLVTTLRIGTYTGEFKVSMVYVGDNSAGFRIVNGFDYLKYDCYLGTPDDKEAFLNGEIENVKTHVETFDWTENYFDLTPNKEYVFYVKGFDRAEGETKLFEIPIKTAELGSDKIPNVDIEIGDADFFIQNYTVTPNAKCKQIALYQQSKGANDGILYGKNNWQGKFIEVLDIWKDMKNIPNNGQVAQASNATLMAKCQTPEMDLDRKLDIYVLIYNEAYEPCCVKKISNTTPAMNNSLATPKKQDFKITMGKVDSAAKTVECTVNYTGNDMRAFFVDVVDKKWLDEEMAKDNYNPYLVHETMFVQRYEGPFFAYNMKNYHDTKTELELKPNTAYYIGVCPMNANGPVKGGWGDLVLEEFTTPAL